MSPIRTAVSAALLLVCAAPALAAPMSDQARLRAQAEHDCYDDVQKLCSDVTSDEEKVKACMSAHRAQLSPKCAKAFSAGMKR